MKEETLQKIKEDYKQIIEKRNHLLQLCEEITKLEEDENVKKYLKIKEELSKIDYKNQIKETDSYILDAVFWRYQRLIQDIDTNDIYVYMGTYMLDNICDIEHGPSDIRLKDDDPRAQYRIYRNIENGYSKEIPISECDEFEKNHKVITDENFYTLQKEFIMTAVNEGQEEACRKILSRTLK